MPISDSYVVQYLLECSSGNEPGLIWRDVPGSLPAFTTRVRELQVTLECLHSSAGMRLALRLSDLEDEFRIVQPLAKGWIGRRLATDEERLLADQMDGLWRAAAAQCSARQMRALHRSAEIRERLFRQLLFEHPEVLHPR